MPEVVPQSPLQKPCALIFRALFCLFRFEIRCTVLPYRGFESHPFRQIKDLQAKLAALKFDQSDFVPYLCPGAVDRLI